jgi:HD-like signal output (HDOD) protein
MDMIFEQRSNEAEQFSSQLTLPSYPKIIQAIDNELKKEETDIIQVANLIAKDPNTSDIALKIVNSALYGLRNKVSSINHAVSMLGIDKIRIVILTPMLKKSLAISNELSDYLWKRSVLVALCSNKLAFNVHDLNADEAYTSGLFQNSGCMVLNNEYSDYVTVFSEAITNANAVHAIENELYGISHVTASFLLSQEWSLSETVKGSILLQHEPSYSAIENSDVRALIAILILANEIVDDIMGVSHPKYNWGFNNRHDTALGELAFEENYFEDFSNDIKADIQDELEDLSMI